MIVVTTESIPGHTLTEALGLVHGSTTRAKHVGRDVMAGLRNVVGGELRQYTELLSDARQEALERMTDHARELGADAVVTVRFTTSVLSRSAAELYAFGTAVKLQQA